jgi:hypothetical protein
MCVFLCCNRLTNRWLAKVLLRGGVRSTSPSHTSGAGWFSKDLPGEKQLGAKVKTTRSARAKTHQPQPRSVPEPEG